MGKNSPSFVLKTVFKDISNIENIIKDSKKIKQSCDKANFNNDKEVEKLIEDTKIIVNSLKVEAAKLDDYFHDNYKTWKNKIPAVTNGKDSSINANTTVNEDIVEKDSSTDKVDENKDVSTEEPAKESVSVTKDDANTNMKKNKNKSGKTEDKKKTEEPQTRAEKNSEKIDKEADHDKSQSKDNSEIRNSDLNQVNTVITTQNVDTTATDTVDNINTNTSAAMDTVAQEPDVNTATETSTADKSESPVEQKIFLKCVDIKKLVKPNILPQIKTPPPRNRDSINDSVLIISDSEDDTNISKMQINKSKNEKDKKDEVQNKVFKSLRSKESLSPNKSNTNKRETRSRKCTQKDSAPNVKKTNKTAVSESASDSDSESCRKKNRRDKNKTQQKRTRPKVTFADKILSDTSSMSESEITSKPEKLDKSKKRSTHARKTEKLILDQETDEKFSSKAYVSLLRIPCEKLEEYYLKQKQIAEVQRLTNLNTLKRSRTNHSTEKKDQSSSDAENIKPKTKKKRSASKNSNSSDGNTSAEEAIVDSSEIVEPETSLSNSKPELEHNEIDQEAANMILDAKSGSDTHESETEEDGKNKKAKKGDDGKKSKKSESDTHESETEEDGKNKKAKKGDDGKKSKKSESDTPESETEEDGKNKKAKKGDDGKKSKKSESDTPESEIEEDGKNKKAKKGDDGKKSKKTTKDNESEEKNEKSKENTDEKEKKKEKSGWSKDKLLTSKISESDSEDELIKFKKRSNVKQIAKSRACRKKLKNVIDSDSDSEAGDKKKDSSGDEFKPQHKSGSSESDSDKDKSEKEEEKEAENKKRRRIKRVKESSSEDENKSTRKTIRRLIGHDSLAETTKQAEKEEKERKARIAERQKKYNKIFDTKELEDASVDKLVLDFNEETKEEILAVNNDLAKKLKPHQVKGVQYMWDACYESVERTKKTSGSGCILAHCMGLGKTLQVITLIHTLLTNEELTGTQRVLVVCPLNTVLNWVAEFKKWLDDIEGPEIEIFDLVSSKQNYERKYQVQEWTRVGGVLVLGYDMFRNLTNPLNKRLKKSEREIFHKGLVNPGPDLVVCDEGHLLKNEKTNLSIAMNRIHTIRRIVLTGTPMQNNMKEYYCMVQFVKPNLLGTYKEYLNRFVNPITNGQYTDSTQHDINIMRKRSHVLHKMLDGVVQRKDYAVLTPYLPPKYEYVLFLTLSEVQINLYRHYLEQESRRPVDTKIRTTFLFMDFQQFQRICTHPRLLLIKSQEASKKAFDEDEDSEGSLKDFICDNESDEESSSSSSSGSSSASAKSIQSGDEKKKKGRKPPMQRVTRNAAATLGIDVEEETQEIVEKSEWWGQYCSGDQLDNIAHSSKLYLLFEILQQCELIGDKLLVFSQSLYSLNIIEYFLAKIDEATQKGDCENISGFSGSWALGLDYFRLDGSSSCDNRSAWCKSFNSPSNPRARLFLISTKAGGLGINLIGANRVIIFDVSWNPSHDIQSIYRVYRFGQTKPCYIYRFVTNGTMEMKVYERQVTKQAISKRVIDEQQIDRHYNQTDLAELYNFNPKPDNQPTPLIPKDVLLAELLQKQKERIFTYHEHQSLLENKEEEELDEAERKAAWEEFENEKTARVVANTTGGWIKNLPISSITAALISIVQKDNATWTREQVQGVVPLIVEQLRDQVEKGEMLLFNRIVTELKLMQASQQQRLQEYYMQQQLRVLQQRYAQQQQNAGPSMGMNFENALRTHLNNQSAPTISNEIVELND